LDSKASYLPQIPGYALESVLGQGGMATVYLAVQESLSRHVALKVMKQALLADEDFRKRFLNEGRLVAQLSHPNIVTVHDIGTAGDSPYLAMTYLPGGTLQARIREGLNVAKAIDVMRRLCDAIGYAHRHGIVHRDIKPGNILFTDDGIPVITDFGIAKSLATETQLTSTGVAMGSVKYMSPEQALGQPVDSRTDLYSLGVLLWLMLTGDYPYRASDPFTVALQHAKQPIPRPAPELERFCPVIEGLLAKQREDRFPSAEAVVEALDAVDFSDIAERVPAPVESTGGSTPVSITADSLSLQDLDPAVATVVVPHDADAPRRRSRWLPVGAALAATALVAAAAGKLLLPSEPETAAPGSPEAAALGPREPAAGRGGGAGSASGLALAPSGEPAGGAGRGIDALLKRADEQWQRGRLTEPRGDNAFETYNRVLELDPQHPLAKQKLVEIGRVNAANRLFTTADHLLREGAIEEARRMISTGLKMNPDDERLRGLQRALE
jgi:serine/threonine-protein kinase PpkA